MTYKFRNALNYMLRTGASPNRASKIYGHSSTKMRKIRRVALKENLTAEKMEELSDTELRELLYGPQKTSDKSHPDWESEIAYLAKGYNRSEAHMRYQDTVPAARALSYSAYCENLRKFQSKKIAVFRHIHVPGRSMQTDYAGYRPDGIDEAGNKKKFNLFLCVLPFSHYIFANVTATQSTTDHIHSHVAALEYFGGSPEISVPDNLKAAVIGFKTGRIPIMNPRFLCFGEHYDIDIRPARVRTPTDKASVEIAVKLVQRLLRLRLKGRPLLPLSEINKLLKEIVETLNRKVMKRAGGLSRRDKFLQVEKDKLQPLPTERLTFLDPPVVRKVAVDYHVGFDNVNYSVHHSLIDKDVTVRGSANVVEIRHDNKVVALHARSYLPHSYITFPEHRPKNHSVYLNDNIEDWAAKQEPLIAEWAFACIPKRAGRRDKTRVLTRLRNTKRIFGAVRLTTAIEKAKAQDALSYSHVIDMLENNMEKVPIDNSSQRLPKPTTNVRGADYFRGDDHVG